jgi:hypothetical protein
MARDLAESGMERLLERAPELATSIQGRFHDDPSFREMCSDYAEALETLQRWQASDDPHRAARVEEYQELTRALEIEMVTTLRARVGGGGSASPKG